jgi:para-aminobenzoate synthetase/4-amino-4-deoxychorismate lyase
MDAVFVLLDDCDATPEAPRSRLYTGWVREHRCHDPATLDAIWAAARADLTAGLHAVLLADYEWGTALQLGRPAALAGPEAAPAALRLLMFRDCARLSAAEVTQWLQQQDDNRAEPGPAGLLPLQPEQDEADFAAAIDQIHAWIRAGDTYQINFTDRLRGQAFGAPLALYRRLRERQPVPFGALMRLPPADASVAADAAACGPAAPEWVLSCSPELFVQHRAGRLLTRPMKGTTARRPDPAEDAAAAAWLAADAKNRAENLMIVDLLRNDLGRIARTGSVRVPQLFQIEPYRTVHQMTSTIEAELPPAADLPAVLRALFPCGSITGAPKLHTMALIERLERSPRGLYTGAIGWLDAPAAPAAPAEPGRALGDFCLSVAIRTLTLGAPSTQGRRAATFGVGAGIVLDSVAADEAAECRLKARFLTTLDPGFTLFETMRVEPDGRVARLDAHLARLAASAQALGFRLDAAEARAAVLAEAAQLTAPAASAAPIATQTTALPPRPAWRLRLDLAFDGTLRLQHGVLAANPPEPVRLLLAEQPLPAHERALLAHKTSLRQTYDAAIRHAEAAGAFDTLFFNAQGELTEGGRSNVFVKLAGRWFTPPLSAGLLPGVMRAALLADPAWAAGERRIMRDDLALADEIVVCNALRGVLRAVAV